MIRVVSQSPLPRVSVGSVVLGRITRLTPTQAMLDIVAVDGTPTECPLRGSLRRDDVFAESLDPADIDMTVAFRGGDLLRATVINDTDDPVRYSLSVADPTMGIMARA